MNLETGIVEQLKVEFIDKGVCDEYRRQKMAWNAIRENIRESEYADTTAESRSWRTAS